MTGRARQANDRPRGIAGPKAEKTVSFALQGGGAHGAFTWGVLDAVLEDGRLAIEAISGTSAGAMNAVVMTEGFLEGGIDGARAQLETFWRRVSRDGSLPDVQRSLMEKVLGFWNGEEGPGLLWFDVVSRVASPYDLNPLNLNPVRGVLEDLIDFEKVRACEDVRLFIAATNVRTGKIKVFEGRELTADHVMASACLPMVFQTVEIDGTPYWDGGYMGNPALYPLFYSTASDDVILVQINPIERKETPRSARDIQNRLNEITFNSSLLRELRAIDFVTRLIDSGKLSKDDYKRVLMHRIDADSIAEHVTAASRLTAEWSLFVNLRDHGRKAARAWLKKNYDAIGARGTLDLRETVD
ncbi:patatin-like phospholipase family protein [Chelatococcus sp. SYSU_G07232]|uniref:Patatin-like phospholipase family protein n=1 Tax=Chelatococcus albus TaxID=3047466 RepID=A0ABT7ADM9_9HYPH|nr:patatin-like phospholipase family protein [Chelatococcus sp. SYSU_G07232]MDJ1157486.1 patatin-like phospholipase family protein [Chelatococcus sp. SYSU_G07232]